MADPMELPEWLISDMPIGVEDLGENWSLGSS
jgi:hypothetical protein